MAIRIVDRRAYRGQLVSALQGASANFQGTHAQPPGRTGTLNAQLSGATASFVGSFNSSINRTGSIVTTLAGAAATMTGTHVAPPGGEHLTSWAALNLQTNPISRINMAQSYPVWVSEGATHTNEPSEAWDGGPCARITPTTITDGYSALGAFGNLHRGGALAIRQLNIRFELMFGTTFGAGQQSKADNKFIIIHAGSTNTATSQHRPMVNIWREGGTLSSLAVGAGTVKQFNPNAPPNEFFPGSGTSDFYWGDSGTTGGAGNKPIIPGGEWVTFETFSSAVPITGFPNGCHRARVTRRSGQIISTVSMPWNYDGWAAVDYFNEIQVLGGYLNGTGGPANANNFQRIAGLTLAANQPGFLGPRPGFVIP